MRDILEILYRIWLDLLPTIVVFEYDRTITEVLPFIEAYHLIRKDIGLENETASDWRSSFCFT